MDKPADSPDIPRIPPEEAWRRLQAEPGAVLVDVRSDMEFLMIGHPKGAVHVPWIDAPDWTVNPGFVAAVRRLLLGRRSGARSGARAGVRGGAPSTPPLLLICRSGNRSADAAAALLADGIDHVWVVEGGFEGPLDEAHHRNTLAGWRHAGLPWEQC